VDEGAAVNATEVRRQAKVTVGKLHAEHGGSVDHRGETSLVHFQLQIAEAD
jgi:hypothetical protein